MPCKGSSGASVSPNEITPSVRGLEDFRNWEFGTVSGESWTPKEAMDYREDPEFQEMDTMEKALLNGDEFTVREVFGADYEGSTMNLAENIINKVKNGEPITVYRSSDIGGIIPGAYVTESKGYAKEHGERSIPGNDWKIYSEKLYADELLWQGDAHEFIYIPRSPGLAYDRYKKGG